MPRPGALHRRMAALGLTTLGVAWTAPAQAQATAPPNGEPLPTLEACAAIGAAADRLACYDRLAGRAPAPTVPAAQAAPPAAADGVLPDSTLRPRDAPLPSVDGERVELPSLMSAYWELDRRDKRGTYNFVGYRANFAMPFHGTTRINRAPSSPTQAAVTQPSYRRIEGKFQLSLRTKVVQGLLLPDADLWLSFTQQAMWQVWNSQDSKPFRNTDYEPEALYVVPIPATMRPLIGGWQWRMAQIGLAHQSNGQSDPLSRSWNRVYLGTGVERGNWSATARFVHRLSEDRENDNNPDLIDYRGRWDLQLNWASGPAVVSLQYRSTLQDTRYGALQLEASYPVFGDQPNGIRWYAQLFRGYGETLTDYNFRQTSLGLGLSFLQF